MNAYNDIRIRHVNPHDVSKKGHYVLYWMQIYRRLDHNHALDHALMLAGDLKKPLVVYEGLKLGYPWASRRLHRFILEGMQANVAKAAKLGINYWPFVETPDDSGRGLLRRLSAKACAVVTDDYPCFIIPEQTEALARKTGTAVIAVDGNSVVPLVRLGEPVVTAAQLRRRIHREFPAAWPHRAEAKPRFSSVVCKLVAPPFDTWKCKNLDVFVASLPIDATVPPVPDVSGGTTAARNQLKAFVARRLPGYAEERSPPTSPEKGHASGLSPYLHFGHIAIEEVVAAALESTDWSIKDLQPKLTGKREGFYCCDADVNSFLDEAITWRDVGLNWHRGRWRDTAELKTALPGWAWKTLQDHRKDRREFLYSPEEWEAAQTHDPLWNAAQTELKVAGTIQNYLRMLWGKKVIEWSKTPEEAYATLVHLNNKYALDGRDPNSYTGILWCFGLFDRPWAPERRVFGTVRYMSSDNTARKFKLGGYLRYVDSLSHG